MLLNEPLFYYKNILKQYPNSYLAEDETQAIIGIDANYLEGDEIDEIRPNLQRENYPKFAGLFGAISYEMVHKLEKIGEKKEPLYGFPNFIFADAKGYLHYDKQSKIYTKFGENHYFENLDDENQSQEGEYFYQILSDEKGLEADFSDEFVKAMEYIKSGDIFQVVLSKTLHLKSNLPSLNFYKKLKTQNPSPYMFHLPTPYGDIVGSSPELLVSLKNNQISISPIAGTRSRGADANEDEKISKELLSDTKELAEHRMLVDLARNDLGRVAKHSSVRVQNPMHIKKFEKVMHIATDVSAQLHEDFDGFDLLRATFPAGTLSGSPKIRAMQIINELEKHQRGAYGGGVGFLHFNSDMQFAITIRSAIFVNQNVFITAGAGVVFDSVDKFEYLEICKKRSSCLGVFESLCEKK